jgi:hypothetical protein
MRSTDNFATFICRLSENPGRLSFMETLGSIYASMKIALILPSSVGVKHVSFPISSRP